MGVSACIGVVLGNKAWRNPVAPLSGGLDFRVETFYHLSFDILIGGEVA